MTSLPYTPWPCTPCRKPVNSHRRPKTRPIFTSSSGRLAASLPPGMRLSVRFPAAAAAAAAPPSSSSSAPAGVPPLGIRPGDRFSSKNPNVSPPAPRHHPPDPGQIWQEGPVLIPELTLAKSVRTVAEADGQRRPGEEQLPQPRLLDGDIVGKRLKFKKTTPVSLPSDREDVQKSPLPLRRVHRASCPLVGTGVTSIILRRSGTRSVSCPCCQRLVAARQAGEERRRVGAPCCRDAALSSGEEEGEAVSPVDSTVDFTGERRHRANRAVKSDRLDTGEASGQTLSK